MAEMTCDGCVYYVSNGSVDRDGVCTKEPPKYDAVFRVTRYTLVPGNWMACGCFFARARERSLLTELQRGERTE